MGDNAAKAALLPACDLVTVFEYQNSPDANFTTLLLLVLKV